MFNNFNMTNGIRGAIFLVAGIIVLVAVLADTVSLNLAKQAVGEAVNTNFLRQPLQADATGKTFIRVGGTDVEIRHQATYSIQGRVVSLNNFLGYSVDNRFAPKDVALAWDFLADTSVDEKVNWGSMARYYYFSVRDGQWLRSVGGEAAVINNSSNNHLIASNNRIKRLIRGINIGDYVQLDGYLVDASWKIRGGYDFRRTSLVRTDTGPGACEIIFVTDVKWLQSSSYKLGTLSIVFIMVGTGAVLIGIKLILRQRKSNLDDEEMRRVLEEYYRENPMPTPSTVDLTKPPSRD